MKVFDIILIIGCTLLISARRHTSLLSEAIKKKERGLMLSNNGFSDKWMKSVGRKLGLTEKDLEVNFDNTNGNLESSRTFQEAWKEFQDSAGPSIKMFDRLNKEVSNELQTAGKKEKLDKVARSLANKHEEKDDKAKDDKSKNEKEDTEEPEEAEEEEEEEPEEKETSKHEKEKSASGHKKHSEKHDHAEDNKEEGKDIKAHSSDIIARLKKRVEMINDKVDHLMFHNHHDLAGTTAHYTPFGVQMLPSFKSKDSVDQKLKAIDYMHNLGGGYNPMLHTLLPYYLGQTPGSPKGIKFNGMTRKLKGLDKKITKE